MANVDYFYNEDVFKFLTWILISGIGYTISYFNTKSWRIPKFILPLTKKFCITEENDFDVQHFGKTPKQWAYALAYFTVISCVHYYFANVNNRIHFEWTSILYIIPIYITIIVFGWLGELRGAQTSCSSGSVRSWPLMSKLLYGTAFTLFIIDLAFHIYLSYINKTIFWYILSIIAMIISIFVTYKIVKDKEPDGVTLHIHHWFIGFIWGLLFRFDHPASIVSYGICYGLILEESVVYGLGSIFDNAS